MIQFGMNSTYVRFQDRYYHCDGDMDPDNRAITIGGYESAFISDLVGEYIFQLAEEEFSDTTYHGTYRDDGFAVFKGKKTYQQLQEWRDNFQAKVNEIAMGDYLQYTVDVWTPGINHLQNKPTKTVQSLYPRPQPSHT